MGIFIEKSHCVENRKRYLYVGLIFNIGGLAYLKYYNFFVLSIKEALESIRVNVNLQMVNVLIPLGISFFTFRTIGYLLDVEKKRIKATNDWVLFFTYVSFFPSLLSGPIDKAKTFIPQLEKRRVFDYGQAVDGLRQILWGLFKKAVIADNCANITNQIFGNFQSVPSSSLVLGAFLYTIQIYTDFSGYSDMAIGISKLLGINIAKNFNYPFFSQNIAEYWRKWHISLTTWLTEYVFTPLSITFRDLGKIGLILSIIINFTIIGIWHGANWTFVLFGFLHGCYFMPLIFTGKINKKIEIARNNFLPSLGESLRMLKTFTIVMSTLIIFRAESISEAFHYLGRIFSKSLFAIPQIPTGGLSAITTLVFIFLLFLIEWFQREREHGLQINHIKQPFARLLIYYTFIFVIVLFRANTANQFIYFKF